MYVHVSGIVCSNYGLRNIEFSQVHVSARLLGGIEPRYLAATECKTNCDIKIVN